MLRGHRGSDGCGGVERQGEGDRGGGRGGGMVAEPGARVIRHDRIMMRVEGVEGQSIQRASTKGADIAPPFSPACDHPAMLPAQLLFGAF